jgi:gamma-glutamyltranspeptidase/glutathione hydrolase
VVALLDDDCAPQGALDRPRLCLEPVDGTVTLALEDGIPAATVQALADRGHRVHPGVSGFDRSLFGRGQIIRVERDGQLVAGSDVRADGCAGRE